MCLLKICWKEYKAHKLGNQNQMFFHYLVVNDVGDARSLQAAEPVQDLTSGQFFAGNWIPFRIV